MAKKKKYQGHENPALALSERERARSSAAGTHDNRPNRQRTRAGARAAAIRAGGY